MLKRLAHWTARFQHSAFAFPLAGLVAGLMIMISEAGYHESEAELGALVQLGQARLKLVSIVRRLSDAESSQRGYLITRSTDYLNPYHKASQDITTHMVDLQALNKVLGDTQAEAQRVVLQGLVDTRMSEIAEVLRIDQEGRHEQAVALLLSGIGHERMEAIRRQEQEMLAVQNLRIERGLGDLADTFLLHRIGVAAMTAISLLVLGMSLHQGRQLNRQRLLQQSATLAERDRLQTDVSRRTQDLTELARHLQNVREDERAHLARELHDELGALFTTAKLDVARMKPKIQQHLPELMERLTHLIDTLNSGVALKRRIVEDLRPSTLDNLGLCASLEILCRESGERLGVPIDVQLETVPLTRSAELTVYRLVQEALTNVAKYAQASRVTVSLRQDSGWALVCIQDNGVGFDPHSVARATHGLLGMRYRVESEHGELRLSTAPGQGTTLRAQLPVHAAPAPASASADTLRPV